MSVFSQVHAKFYLDIPVYKMNELKESTRYLISRKLFQYDDTLNGVILAFKNAAPVDRFARFYADTPSIHMQMEADFIVFKPKIGTILPAKVTFVTANSVTLSVLGTFTANVDVSELKKDWSFSRSVWRKGADSFGENDTLQVSITESIPTSNGLDFTVNVIKKLSESSDDVENGEIAE